MEQRTGPYAARDVWAEEQVHEAEQHDELRELDAVPVVHVAVAVDVVGLRLRHLDLELVQALVQLLAVDRPIGVLVCSSTDDEMEMRFLQRSHFAH